jgi:hypothetical protein
VEDVLTIPYNARVSRCRAPLLGKVPPDEESVPLSQAVPSACATLLSGSRLSQVPLILCGCGLPIYLPPVSWGTVAGWAMK